MSEIACEHVTKRYADVTAVDDVSLNVEAGEIFGLIGPNGAGKTTLIEMMESLRRPDSGRITVHGLDPTREPGPLREEIGLQLQATSVQPNMKVKEAVLLFARLYRHPIAEPLALLEVLSLRDKADSQFRKLSGGQKQRVAIALALVNDPKVVFFDEISTGLDPQARRGMWDLVRDIRGRGKTVFLTTHYMEEAEALCDRVAIIDHGRIIALDAPANLVKSLKADVKIRFSVSGGDRRPAEPADFASLLAVTRTERSGGEFVLYTADDAATLQALIRLAGDRDFRVNDIRTESPNLDDVFLTLTGKGIRE